MWNCNQIASLRNMPFYLNRISTILVIFGIEIQDRLKPQIWLKKNIQITHSQLITSTNTLKNTEISNNIYKSSDYANISSILYFQNLTLSCLIWVKWPLQKPKKQKQNLERAKKWGTGRAVKNKSYKISSLHVKNNSISMDKILFYFV